MANAVCVTDSQRRLAVHPRRANARIELRNAVTMSSAAATCLTSATSVQCSACLHSSVKPAVGSTTGSHGRVCR